MRIGQVPVNLANQHAPITMSEPARNSHEVQTGHHALRGEKMPEIMKTGAGQPGRGVHQLKRFSQTFGGNIALAPLRTREEKAGIRGAGVVHLVQKAP